MSARTPKYAYHRVASSSIASTFSPSPGTLLDDVNRVVDNTVSLKMTLEDLLAEREIYRKLVTFAQAMDERQWQLIDDIAVADMTANLGMGELQGLPRIVDFIRSFLDQCGPSQHLLANVIIDINGESATSSAYVSDMHVGRGDKSDLNFRTLGQYHDHWQKIEDRWLMTRRVKVNRAVIGSLEALGSDLAP